MTIDVFELGAQCMIDGEIPATITAVSIRPAENSVRISYEVTWWDERTRKSEWVEPGEIKAKEAKSGTLHFAPLAS